MSLETTLPRLEECAPQPRAIHPRAEQLTRFACGYATKEERALVLRHLFTRCPACAAFLRNLYEPEPKAGALRQGGR